MIEPGMHILELASRIVTAHLSHNSVRSEKVPDLIRSVYSTLADLGREAPPFTYAHLDGVDDDFVHRANHEGHVDEIRVERVGPPARAHVHPTLGQTVFSDQLLCMECGLRMKMLKRHLQTVHALTPRDYRTKWNLPAEYPMVASDYAKLRSSLALESGLGLKPDARAERQGRGPRPVALR